MIDLAKIIAEKRHIKNEPVLLRDILPKVMRDIRRQRRCRANADSCDRPGQSPATAIQGKRRQRNPERSPAAEAIECFLN